MSKWIALGCIAFGIGLLYAAYRMDSYSSLDLAAGGNFIGELGLILLGIACLAVGAIWLLVLLFLHL